MAKFKVAPLLPVLSLLWELHCVHTCKMPCSHCLYTRLLSGKYPCPTLSLSTTLSPPSFSLLSLLPPYSSTPPHSFSVSLSLFLSLVFVYLGFVPGISPVSLPAPRRLHPLDEQHTSPPTPLFIPPCNTHTLPPTSRPPASVAKQLPATRAGAFFGQSN